MWGDPDRGTAVYNEWCGCWHVSGEVPGASNSCDVCGSGGDQEGSLFRFIMWAMLLGLQEPSRLLSAIGGMDGR